MEFPEMISKATRMISVMKALTKARGDRQPRRGVFI
jgi:hypothetical protein